MLDLDKRSKVVNLCPWTVSFVLPNSNSEVILDANKTTTLNNSELVSLAENHNIMFWGTENGNHARIYVDNEDFRKYVGFDDPENKINQFVLNDEECQKLLDLKTDKAFEKNVKEKVVLEHEKAIFIEYCIKVKLNDFGRIQFIEEHTGKKFKMR